MLGSTACWLLALASAAPERGQQDVLVIGGTYFLGKHVCPRARARAARAERTWTQGQASTRARAHTDPNVYRPRAPCAPHSSRTPAQARTNPAHAAHTTRHALDGTCSRAPRSVRHAAHATHAHVRMDAAAQCAHASPADVDNSKSADSPSAVDIYFGIANGLSSLEVRACRYLFGPSGRELPMWHAARLMHTCPQAHLHV